MLYSHELGLHRLPYRDHLRSSASNEPLNNAHLTSCLVNCKGFFEYLLSLPESIYPNFTTVQWSSIVQAIVVLSRLTFLMAAKLGWDANTTRSNVPLIMYLDALMHRFQQLSSTASDGPATSTNPDRPHVLMLLLGSVKKSYERRVTKIEPRELAFDGENWVGAAGGHCPVLDPSFGAYFDAADSTSGGSFDFGGSGTPSVGAAATPLYHDIWATMTSSVRQSSPESTYLSFDIFCFAS